MIVAVIIVAIIVIVVVIIVVAVVIFIVIVIFVTIIFVVVLLLQGVILVKFGRCHVAVTVITGLGRASLGRGFILHQVAVTVIDLFDLDPGAPGFNPDTVAR